MNNKVSFFNFSLKKIITDEQPTIDQVKIRLLYNGFWIVFAAVSGLFLSVYSRHQENLTVMAGVVLVCLIALFKYLTYRPQWLQISHMLLILATLISLTNVYVLIQSAGMITVQVILLAMLFSYYMLGHRWGVFYSLLNLIPVIIFLILKYNGKYAIAFRPETLGDGTIIIGLFASFIVIIFIHSHFYLAYIKNIKQLKETSDQQTELNKKLGYAIEKAEKSSKVKSEFLSLISHEIRTPLNAVMGISNLLAMNNPRPDQKENLNILKHSVNNLLLILNDILDFNKIEAGKVVFEGSRFSLAELMKNIWNGQIAKAEDKGLVFNLLIDPLINDKILLGDQTRLSQILFNLVSNAIKFTKEGKIWVKALVQEARGNFFVIRFIVQDTGIGIEPSKLETIFEPFNQQPQNEETYFGGTGLGLPIAKRLLQLQGVALNVSSTVGKGSQFSFQMEFPVYTETSEQLSKKRVYYEKIVEEGPLRVLIAEDNPINVLLMKKLLARWNIVPTIAENGERAVEMLQYDNFDIILMDVQMPVLDGFEATIEIRKLTDPRKSSIPIIALTASGLHDIKERVLNCGMNDYVGKPFKPEDLMEKIHSHVAGAY